MFAIYGSVRETLRANLHRDVGCGIDGVETAVTMVRFVIKRRSYIKKYLQNEKKNFFGVNVYQFCS